MIFALAILATAMATPADSAPGKYQIHATVIQDGKTLYDPRLVSNARETAAFVADNGATNYTLKVVANPDSTHAAGVNGVSLSVDLTVGRQENNRHIATTVVAKAGEPLVLNVPAADAHPAVTVNISADKV